MKRLEVIIEARQGRGNMKTKTMVNKIGSKIQIDRTGT